jgi:hypothetical protein
MVLSTDTQQKQERDVTTSKGFEKAILAKEQLQTYALDLRVIGNGLPSF